MAAESGKAGGAELAGTLWILLTALLWSFLGLISKYCLAAGMTPLECAFFRALFGCLAFAAHCAVTGLLRAPGRHELLFMLFGVWGIGCYFALAQYTIRFCGAAMDIILQYTAPFWVAFFAWRFFGERLTRAKLTAIGIAAVGTLCVCCSGGSIPEGFSAVGIATGLASGLCYATHYPFIRYWQGRYPTAVIFAWMLAGGALLLLVLLPANAARSGLSPAVWCASAATGVVCTYLAFICYAKALQRISLVRAVVASELEPVLSMLWVWLAFGERFSFIGWVGSAGIILSVLALSVSRSEN